MLHYSPSLAAFWAIVVAISLSCVSRATRPPLMKLARCLARGAQVGAQIGIALAVVGLMSQTLITTGLGTKIAGLVELLSGGQLWIALIWKTALHPPALPPALARLATQGRPVPGHHCHDASAGGTQESHTVKRGQS